MPVGVVDLVDVVVTGWVAAPPPPRAKTWLALEASTAATPRSSAAFDNGVMVVPLFRRKLTAAPRRAASPDRETLFTGDGDLPALAGAMIFYAESDIDLAGKRTGARRLPVKLRKAAPPLP